MFVATILSLILGQCGPNGCSRPTAPAYPSPVQSPSYYPISAPTRPATRPMGRYMVNYMGVDVLVEGTMTERGTVIWNPASPTNRELLKQAGQRLSQAERPKANPEIKNYGLDPSRLFVSRNPSPQAMQFIEGSPGKETAERLHLTLIGSKDEQARFLADLKTSPALSPIKDSLFVQTYLPGDWSVDPSLGFPKQGFMLQDRSGKVLYRAEKYDAASANGVNRVACEALRRPKPNYDPSLDPGPATGRSGCPLGFTWELTIVLVGALAVALKLPRKP